MSHKATKKIKTLKSNRIITFVANTETQGDGSSPNTMDFFHGIQFPWLSIAIPLLNKMGFATEVLNWEDKGINWKDKQLIIIGPIWGYSKQQSRFQKWLRKLELLNAPLENSAKFLKWNLKKTYLKDLQQANINIPNTIIVSPKSKKNLNHIFQDAHQKWHTDDIIIKGVIDAAGIGFKHINISSKRNVVNDRHFKQLKIKNEGVVIQPFLPEIGKKGELSFVFFGSKLSHFYLKVAGKGEDRIQVFYGGRSFHVNDANIAKILNNIKKNFRSDLMITPTEINEAKKQAILSYNRLTQVLKKKRIKPPLYLRLDGVMSEGKLLVMELEGIEPYMEMKEAMQANSKNNVIGKYVKAINDAYYKKN